MRVPHENPLRPTIHLFPHGGSPGTDGRWGREPHRLQTHSQHSQHQTQWHQVRSPVLYVAGAQLTTRIQQSPLAQQYLHKLRSKSHGTSGDGFRIPWGAPVAVGDKTPMQQLHSRYTVSFWHYHSSNSPNCETYRHSVGGYLDIHIFKVYANSKSNQSNNRWVIDVESSTWYIIYKWAIYLLPIDPLHFYRTLKKEGGTKS